MAVHVTPGRERAMAARLSRLAGDGLASCFVLRTEIERKREGVWRPELVTTFPGYVFAELTGDGVAARTGAAGTAALTSAISMATTHAHLVDLGGRAATLSAHEARLLRALMGPDHVIRSSEGCFVGSRLVVWAGPLKGRESLVSRIDRHRSCAFLSGAVAGMELCVGLAVVARVPKGTDAEAVRAERARRRAQKEVAAVSGSMTAAIA